MWRDTALGSHHPVGRTARWLTAAAIACVLSAVSGSDLFAQNPETWDAGRLQLTRAELELLLRKYEQTGRSATYSNEFKVRARSEAELVSKRLAEGDFQVGDQIELIVDGEDKMPPTLTVGPGRVLSIPNLGELSLAGVLRSELNDKVLHHVARYVKSPSVRTRSNIRIAIMGQVANPGFRTVASESLLSDIIMAAGGPTPAANLSAARVDRGAERIWEGQVLQEAIAEGRTLDQMSLRSGDQLIVPQSNGRGSTFMGVVTILPAAILAVTGLLRIL